MITAEWIIRQFDEWAPQACAEDWDNVGLLIGDAAQPVKKILVALDATEEVINEAISGGFDFIISHHPLVYNPIKRITSVDSTGRKIIALIKNGIGCFCAHTNLDKAIGGVNDCLAEKIGLGNLTPLIYCERSQISASANDKSTLNSAVQKFDAVRGLTEGVDNLGIGRVGFLSEKMTLSQLAEHVKTALNLPSLRYSGDTNKLIKKIGICGGDGSGSRYIDAAIKQNCDVYITGDLRYHCVQEALETGIAFLDITHYGGEIPIVDEIVSRLKNHIEIFPSSIDGQVFTSI